MKELFEEKWCCLQCGQCRWFKVDAYQPGVESICKRIEHKHFKFAVPWFKVYDCGRTNGIVCRDFEPAEYVKWLRDHWVSYDDYYQGDKPKGLVFLTIDEDTSVRYGVLAKDFVDGTFIDENGELKWVQKKYYKRTKHSPTGYILATEWKYPIVNEEEKIVEIKVYED